MSYTFLADAVAVSLAECFSGIPASALSKLNLTAGKSYFKDNATKSCHDSQSGMMLKPLMGNLGAEKLILSAGGFHARTLAAQEPAKDLKAKEADYGEKCIESFLKYDLDTHSWKTRQCLLSGGLEEFSETWPNWGIQQDMEFWGLTISGLDIIENESGFLPTPCKKDADFIRYNIEQRGEHQIMLCNIWQSENSSLLNPVFSEMIMDWPKGWTDLQPLGMDSFQAWLRSHGDSYQTTDLK